LRQETFRDKFTNTHSIEEARTIESKLKVQLKTRQDTSKYTKHNRDIKITRAP